MKQPEWLKPNEYGMPAKDAKNLYMTRSTTTEFETSPAEEAEGIKRILNHEKPLFWRYIKQFDEDYFSTCQFLKLLGVGKGKLYWDYIYTGEYFNDDIGYLGDLDDVIEMLDIEKVEVLKITGAYRIVFFGMANQVDIPDNIAEMMQNASKRVCDCCGELAYVGEHGSCFECWSKATWGDSSRYGQGGETKDMRDACSTKKAIGRTIAGWFGVKC